MPNSDLLATLPPVQRFALAYAPAAVRPVWLGLLALDARLARVVRSAREPVLGQLRLAWWREKLTQDDLFWPEGDPVLDQIGWWRGHYNELVSLVDGWEAMLGDAPLDETALSDFANGRANAIAGLTRVLGVVAGKSEVIRLARGWALGDVAANLSHPQEIAAAHALAAAHDWRGVRLPRHLRPLTVLHGLVARQRNAPAGVAAGLGTVLAGIRLGIFGA